MTKEELRNHIADVLNDDAPIPKELALDGYTETFWNLLTTIDQNARLETVKSILESVDDETRQDLESYKVIQALSHPLNK